MSSSSRSSFSCWSSCRAAFSAGRRRPAPEMPKRDLAAPRIGMMGESFAWLLRASPLQRIAPHLRSRVLVGAVFALALLFPLLHPNDADIDSAANALTYAALALGLNIVVGLAGLLDLGYAAFFAIGAYAYGVAASWQVTPAWSEFWEVFRWLGLVARVHEGTADVVH